MTAIQLNGLTRRFGSRTAVDSLSFQVEEGEVFSLLGVNGAGKTTAIKMLCGLLPPSEGDALILGHSITKEPEAAKQLINVSPQETAVAPGLSVKENLELIARIYGASKSEAERRADAIMAEFGLSDRAKDRARTLSGGLSRRLSIAMALISEPKIVFLDEPTLGLDVRARRDLWRVVSSLKGRVTVMLTTHYLEEAEALSDRVAVLHEGRLRALGTPKELESMTNTENVEDAFLALTEETEK
jgi:ABC-2 type transport system ATP-binding protein